MPAPASPTRRRGLFGAVSLAVLTLGLWAYDALGRHAAASFEAAHAADPAAVLERWQSYQWWHPTRHWLRPAAAWAEAEHLTRLAQAAREQLHAEALAGLRHRAADPDADPEALWQELQALRSQHPDLGLDDEASTFRAALKARRDGCLSARAQPAFLALLSAEQRGEDLAALAAQAGRFLADYPGSKQAAEVQRRQEAYLLRLDERDLEPARSLSAQEPLHFAARRDLYQAYLDKHPGGAGAGEARTALQAIARAWDQHDFRAVRDQYTARPGDVAEVAARCRLYRTRHPEGRFAAAAADLLRWTERIRSPGQYRVVLRKGQIEQRLTSRLVSRGPDLSVELEVAGVRYGPSNITTNSYTPEWNYEFPRRIRWQLGDPVRIRVTDHDYVSRVVLDIASVEGEPLALQLLTGEVWSGGTMLGFESDFRLPELPPVEDE